MWAIEILHKPTNRKEHQLGDLAWIHQPPNIGETVKPVPPFFDNPANQINDILFLLCPLFYWGV